MLPCIILRIFDTQKKAEKSDFLPNLSRVGGWMGGYPGWVSTVSIFRLGIQGVNPIQDRKQPTLLFFEGLTDFVFDFL